MSQAQHIQYEPSYSKSNLKQAFFTGTPVKPVTPVGLRAPELILDKSFNQTVDIWSAGCLLYELLIGQQLFAICTVGCSREEYNDDHLISMHDILGQLPADLMEKWPRRSKYFTPAGLVFRASAKCVHRPMLTRIMHL